MYICHSPSRIAPRKAMNATHRGDRTSRLARNTVQPLDAARFGQELLRWEHLHPCPHTFVPHAAIFVTGHEVLTRSVECRREGRDEAGHQHRIGVRGAHDEAMD